jgi:four helix bundle protein
MSANKTFRFEKLEVWQQARKLNQKIYLFSHQFPESERFGLMSQIRRASVSISSNIAEGSGRNSDIDFSHFLEIAYGSLMEAISQLYLALDENYITQIQMDDISSDAHSLSAQIIALSKALGRKPRRQG